MKTALARFVTTLAVAATVAVYFVLIFTALETAVARGICCADDEAMATIAKNLAFGYGYTVSVSFSGEPGLFPFDWGTLSTGPTLILPAAFFISIFGNEPWVPGLTTVFEITVIFGLLALIHFRRSSTFLASLYMLLFGLLLFAFTGPWFVNWYALLGEMPAGLLCVLGGTLWLGRPRDPIITGISALCFGLAVLAKMVALLGFVPMVLWLIWNLWRNRTQPSESFKLLLAAGAGFLAPIVAFESWKAATLGLKGYLAFWRDGLDFVTKHGASKASLPDRLGVVVEQLEVFSSSFHYSAPLALAVLLAGGLIAWRSPASRFLFLFFGSAALLHWSWWLFVSAPGWPRYMVVGLIYQAAALASLAYALRQAPILAGVGIAAALTLYYPVTRLATWKIEQSFSNQFREDERQLRLREAAAVLQKLPPQSRFVIAGWTSAVGLEYMLPGAGNFTRYDFAKPDDSAEMYLTVDTSWADRWHGFAKTKALCTDIIFDKEPYLIAKCHPPIE